MARMTDAQRLDWLEGRYELMDVYWRMENEGETVREAIDALAMLQEEESNGD